MPIHLQQQNTLTLDTIEAGQTTPGQDSIERIATANLNCVQNGSIVIEKNLYKKTVMQQKLNNLKSNIEERFQKS